MSRAPFVVEKSAKPYPATGNQTMWNTAIGWRMTNRALPKGWTISLVILLVSMTLQGVVGFFAGRDRFVLER